MPNQPRKPFTIRIGVEEKNALDNLAKRSGLETGLVARTVLELFLRQVGDDDSVFQKLADLELAMKQIEITRVKTKKKVA